MKNGGENAQCGHCADRDEPAEKGAGLLDPNQQLAPARIRGIEDSVSSLSPAAAHNHFYSGFQDEEKGRREIK
jgi:hypothetical protein